MALFYYWNFSLVGLFLVTALSMYGSGYCGRVSRWGVIMYQCTFFSVCRWLTCRCHSGEGVWISVQAWLIDWFNIVDIWPLLSIANHCNQYVTPRTYATNLTTHLRNTAWAYTSSNGVVLLQNQSSVPNTLDSSTELTPLCSPSYLPFNELNSISSEPMLVESAYFAMFFILRLIHTASRAD